MTWYKIKLGGKEKKEYYCSTELNIIKAEVHPKQELAST